jgi:predicted amidohydrolase
MDDRPSQKFRAACVQFPAVPEPQANIDRSVHYLREAADAGAELVCFPEYFGGVRSDGPRYIPTAFAEAEHPVLAAMQAGARDTGTWILAGSLGILVADRIVNRAYVISSDGVIVARYDKIHLFDIDLGDSEPHRESATIAPGEQAVVAPTPWGGLGLSICYDLRFPQLYQSLARNGAIMLTVPAGFTRATGSGHWHVLVRARAIETGSYVLAPCQNGTLVGGGESFGHSLIVDPWGRVLADGGEGDGFIVAEIDPAAVTEARTRIPALSNARDFSLARA